MDQSGPVTFLMTDIEGSTRLWDADPDLASEIVRAQEGLIVGCVGKYGGRVIKARGEGDSLFCVFTRAFDAVLAAVEIQRSIAREPWPRSQAPSVRIAIHTGEAEEREEDFYGPVVNRCARIRSAGHGGQILLSQASERLIRDAHPLPFDLEDLGSHRLRDLSRAEVIFQVVHPDLPSQFPPLNTLDVRPHNLPVQLTSFVGRTEEVAQGVRLVRSSRLLTLMGPGGSGKTRLSLQIAAESQELFPGGVWYVDLVPIEEGGRIAERVASELRLGPSAESEVEPSIEQMLSQDKTLLVLDNCEHLVSAASTLAARLLRACASLTILATSRQALGVAGEQLYPVPPMSLPKPADRALAAKLALSDAGHLFQERARAVNPEFAISPRNAAAVCAICSALDGIPLAIELAAARLKALTPEQILYRLQDRFALLAGSRAEVDRHRTLRATIDWSYDLLDEAEKRLFESLAVFQGGWTLDAAEAVCRQPSLEGRAVLDLLQELIDRSTVIAELPPSGEARYRMLETIREYAIERLSGREDADRLREQHFEFFLGFVEEAKAHLTGAGQKVWLDRVESDLDNVRAALEWALGQEGQGERALRMASALAQFWVTRGYASEAEGILLNSLAAAPAAAPMLRADALNILGVLATMQGKLDEALSHLNASLRLKEELGDKMGQAATLSNIGAIHCQLDEPERGLRSFETASELYRLLDTKIQLAYCLLNLGGVRMELGQNVAAASELEQSLGILRKGEDAVGVCYAAANLAAVASADGRFEEASALLLEGIVAGLQSHCWSGLQEALWVAASCFVRAGNGEGACLSLCLTGLISKGDFQGSTPLQLRTADRLKTEIAAMLTPAEVEQIQLRTASLSLEEGLSQVLAMLSA